MECPSVFVHPQPVTKAIKAQRIRKSLQKSWRVHGSHGGTPNGWKGNPVFTPKITTVAKVKPETNSDKLRNYKIRGEVFAVMLVKIPWWMMDDRNLISASVVGLIGGSLSGFHLSTNENWRVGWPPWHQESSKPRYVCHVSLSTSTTTNNVEWISS